MATTTEKGPDGAEYTVETGFGRLSKVDWPAEGKRNAHVEIAAEGLRYPVKGWASVAGEHASDADTRQVIAQALNDAERVGYRVEVHRDRDLDPAIPLAEVDKTKKFRRLVGVWIVADGGQLNGEQPPPPAGQEPHEVRNTEPPPETTARFPAGGTQADTYAYQAVVGFVELAYELHHRAGPTTGEQVVALARRLLRAADRAQVALVGHIDRNAMSHTRSRGAVRSVVDRQPPPLEGQSDDEWTDWEARVTKGATTLLKIAEKMHREGP